MTKTKSFLWQKTNQTSKENETIFCIFTAVKKTLFALKITQTPPFLTGEEKKGFLMKIKTEKFQQKVAEEASDVFVLFLKRNWVQPFAENT